jgi:hypothetical protein
MTNSQKKILRTIFTIGVLVILAESFIRLQKNYSPNKDDLQLEMLQKIASQISVPANTFQVSESSSSKSSNAGVYKRYTSSKSAEEIVSFYRTIFERDGWRLVKKDEENSFFRFGKETVFISLQIMNLSNEKTEYAIDVIWRAG